MAEQSKLDLWSQGYFFSFLTPQLFNLGKDKRIHFIKYILFLTLGQYDVKKNFVINMNYLSVLRSLKIPSVLRMI